MLSFLRRLSGKFEPVGWYPHTGNILYRPDIDGLRALAVLSVVAFHAFPNTVRGGFVGVDIFFVISGYLISSIIVQELEKKSFSIISFYKRRIKRIFPALIIVLLSAMIFSWFSLLPNEYKTFGKHTFGGAAFISNFILWTENGYFDTSGENKPLLHLWSLGIEEQFYIFFPLILWMCAKNKLRIPTVVAILCLFSFLDNLYLFRKAPVVDFYSPLTRSWELMSGAVLSTAFRYQAIQAAYLRVDAYVAHCLREDMQPNDGRTISLILALIGIVLIGAALFLSSKEDFYPGWKALLPVSGAVCLLAAGPSNVISKALLSNRVAVFIGLVSYPLYLWHWPLLSFNHIIFGDFGKNTPLVQSCLVVTSFILAIATYFLIERPVRFFQKNTNILTIILLILMAFIGILGGIIYMCDGLSQREGFQKYVEISRQLEPFETHDVRAYEYDARIPDDPNTHTRYSNAHSGVTVAIYGDSHALSGFQGIEMLNSKHNINTLLISRNSSRLPILGLLFGNSRATGVIANNILEILC